MKKIIIFVFLLLLAGIIFLGVILFFQDNSGKGALQVTSTPVASVFLNGEKIGDTPLCKCNPEDLIETGEHSIKLVPANSEFGEFEEKITINKSTLTVIDKEFEEGSQGSSSIISLTSIPSDKEAELLIMSLPNDTSVFLNNKPSGTTPFSLKESKSSDYILNITKEGYKDRSVAIKTALGFKLTALISLGILPVSSPSAQEQPQAVNKIVILDTPTGFLRVRSASSTASLEIDRVNPGETFDLVSEGDGWLEIKLDDETTGWISGQYAEKQ